MRYYMALVHKDPDSDFGVSFPDFLGCISAGCTLDEAAAMAAEAHGGHIDLMAEDGLPIPEPTDLDTLMEDPENRGGVPVMVPARTSRSAKAVRVNITLPKDVLRQIDRHAERYGFTRSGFLAQAARRAMGEAA